MNSQKRYSQRGFSMIELLAVLIIMTIGATLTIFAFAGHRRMYNTEDQSLQIIDVLQKARQFSITKRRTMRVEFNLDRNNVRLIDENQPGNAADDEEVSTLELRETAAVRIGNTSPISTRPSNVTQAPPQAFPCPDAIFTPSVHTSSIGQRTLTLRFMRNGSVTSAGSDAIGTNSTIAGSTIYIWEPAQTNAEEAKTLSLVRAISVVGISGSIQYWKHEATNSGGLSNSGWRNNR